MEKRMREIFVDGRSGDDANNGESWEQAWRTENPLRKLAKNKTVDDRYYVRIRNAEIIRPEELNEDVFQHEEHYFVDGTSGDDSADGLSWETALQTSTGLDTRVGETFEGQFRQVRIHVRNIEWFRTEIHVAVQNEAHLVLRRGEEPRRNINVVVTGYPATA